MSRYIDADKALEDADTIDPKYKTLIEQVKRIINAQPTADVVEVVRCKDCKYQPQAVRRWYDNDTIATYVWCEEMYCADRDNFCPYGKKDGEEE